MNTKSSGDSLGERFEEALELARSGQYARAANLLAECVAAEPGNPAFIRALLDHATATPAIGENGHSAPGEMPPDLAQAIAESNWPQVQRLAPRFLAAHADHLPSLIALAAACAAQGESAGELCYLERAGEIAPDNLEVNRRLGRALFKLRRLDEALARWRRVEEIDDADTQAAQAIAELVRERSRQRAGLMTAEREQWQLAAGANGANGNHRPTAKLAKSSLDRLLDASASSAPGAPNIKRTPIQELEVAIREFPSNADYYIQIVPLYLQSGREYDAEKLLAKGRQATSNDPRVCQLWEDVTMLRMDKKLALAKKLAQESDTPETQKELAQIVAERDQVETDIFVSRCQREPQNAAVRVQLGMRLRRAGKVREACQRLEEALRDRNERPHAALELGECHRQQSNYQEALRFFRMAADAALQPEHLAARKQALYHAGGLASKLRMRRLAERYLSELVRLDANYKDAPAMLAEARRQLAAL